MNYRLCSLFFLIFWGGTCSAKHDPIEIEDVKTLREEHAVITKKLGKIFRSLKDLKNEVSRLQTEEAEEQSEEEHDEQAVTAVNDECDDLMVTPGHVYFTASPDFVQVAIKHKWTDIDAEWYICGSKLTDVPGRTTLNNGNGTISAKLWLTGDNAWAYSDRRPSCYRLSINLEIGEHLRNAFQFDMRTLLEMNANATRTSQHNCSDNGVFRVEPIELDPLQVGGGLRQKYVPGEQLEVSLRMNGNELVMNPSYSTVIYFFANDSLRVNQGRKYHWQPEPDFTVTGNVTYMNSGGELSIQFDTSRIPEGGLFQFYTRARVGTPAESLVLYRGFILLIYLIPRSSSEPIPRGSIGFETIFHPSTRKLTINGTNILGCHAIGNPRPRVEFFVNNVARNDTHTRYEWKYGSVVSFQLPSPIPPDMFDDEFECRAGLETLTFDIEITGDLVENLTRMDKISANEVSFSCAVRGRPIPNVKFFTMYEGYRGTRIRPTDAGVTITLQESPPVAITTLLVDRDKYKPTDYYGKEVKIDAFECLGYAANGENNWNIDKYYSIL